MIDAPAPLKKAFALLANAEMEGDPSELAERSPWQEHDWDKSSRCGNETETHFCYRVESLAILLGIIPRRCRLEMKSIAEMWCVEFSDRQRVGLDELRRVTRRWLRQRDRRTATIPSFLATAVSIAQSSCRTRGTTTVIDANHDAQLPSPAGHPARVPCATEGEQDCVYGLQRWFDHLHRKQSWTHIPSVVPGDKPVPIDEMFVELELYEDRSDENDKHLGVEPDNTQIHRSVSQINPSQQRGVDAMNWRAPSPIGLAQDIRTIVARTLDRCVIVGGPGSGKSTLIQWLAHTIAESSMGEFDVPIVIKLKDYAQAITEQPELSPLQFFFASLDAEDIDTKAASRWLRHVSDDRDRVLLMCDGWDEVPAAQRDSVREQLEYESDHFVTLITSRPAGLPQSLRDREHVDFYRIGKLRTHQMNELANNLIRSRYPKSHPRRDDAKQIIDQIRSLDDLHGLAQYPLFLGQILHVFLDAYHIPSGLSSTKVIAQLVAWMQKRPHFSGNASAVITQQHLQALSRFAYNRRFGHQREHAQFHETELQRATAAFGVSESAILASRLLDRGSEMIDEYHFVDPAFSTYFAALQVAEMEDIDAQSSLFDHAIQSEHRVSVLYHAVLLSERFRNVALERTQHWLRHGDAFQQILLRLAKLAVVSRDAQRNTHQNDSTLIEWSRMITPIRNHLWRLTQQSGDPNARRMYVETLAALDPGFLHWKSRSRDVLDDFLLRLIRRLVPDPVGLSTSSSRGVMPSHALHESQSPAAIVHCCVACTESFGSLQREQWIRRLAVLRADHPDAKRCIESLAGHPVDQGANVVMGIAMERNLPDELRVKAIEISMHSADREVAQSLVNQIDDEQSPLLQSSLLRLAITRQILLDLDWLECQIRNDTSNALRLLRLQAYCGTAAGRTAEERQRMGRFLSELTLSALKHGEVSLTELLLQHFRLDGDQELSCWIDHRVVAAAIDCLIHFIHSPPRQPIHAVSLSANVLASAPCEGNRVHLNKALDTALSMLSSDDADSRSDDDSIRWERSAKFIADCLVKVDPGSLLRYEASCRPVQHALQDAVFKRGWLIFNDRILDNDGIEIAVRTDAWTPLDQGSLADADVIDEIVHDLPPRQRNDFLSYWHMVSVGDADYALTERERVHEAICTLMASDLNTELSERLWSCYQEGRPPSFASWKKNLARVVQRFEDRPEVLAHLQQLGLGIHKRKPR
ncbi:NACHT domain-containing protein [Novipirellula caenicola]|uniref:NACHT domain-containing protein n=1 Tax=Novipirellula caenicola TaxID=1536901 RepID=A0ABP9W342_9BACT